MCPVLLEYLMLHATIIMRPKAENISLFKNFLKNVFFSHNNTFKGFILKIGIRIQILILIMNVNIFLGIKVPHFSV